MKKYQICEDHRLLLLSFFAFISIHFSPSPTPSHSLSLALGLNKKSPDITYLTYTCLYRYLAVTYFYGY